MHVNLSSHIPPNSLIFPNSEFFNTYFALYLFSSISFFYGFVFIMLNNSFCIFFITLLINLKLIFSFPFFFTNGIAKGKIYIIFLELSKFLYFSWYLTKNLFGSEYGLYILLTFFIFLKSLWIKWSSFLKRI